MRKTAVESNLVVTIEWAVIAKKQSGHIFYFRHKLGKKLIEQSSDDEA